MKLALLINITINFVLFNRIYVLVRRLKMRNLDYACFSFTSLLRVIHSVIYPYISKTFLVFGNVLY